MNPPVQAESIQTFRADLPEFKEKSAAFGPVMLLSLFWKRSNRAGAIAGMITGGAMVFLWKYGLAPLGGVFAIYELLPAFIAALLVNVAVSLATPAPDADIVRQYEEVSAASRG